VTALAVLTLSRVLYGPCELSRSDLLNSFFSHTEIAHAFALMALALMMRGRLLLAAAATGLAFDINAFVGAWLGVPLALGLLAEWPRKPLNAWLLRCVAAGGIALIIAAPVLAWIIATREPLPAGLDYRAFMWNYARPHFFLSASSTMSHVQFVLISLSGALAIRVLNLGKHTWLAFAGLLAVFVFGAGVGAWTHSVILLNLHLLRIDALIIMMTAVLIATVAVRDLDAERPLRTLAALVLVAGLVAKVWFLAPLVLSAMIADDGGFGHKAQELMGRAKPIRFSHFLQRILMQAAARPARLAWAALVLFAAFATAAGVLSRERLVYRGGTPSRLQLIGAHPAAPQWQDITQWARASTPQGAVFLLIKPIDGFRVASQRAVWVDPKEGAAVMWKPSFHAIWSARNRDMDALVTLDQAVAYACARHIDYVVRARTGARSTKAVIVKQNDVFLVADAKASCADRGQL
jgi:hypothetical protein